MPESTFLHIETRDSAPTRVLEIPGASVRIGRGEQCEVRLGEPSLAEVQCMLRRRGEGWHIQPVGPPGRVSIEGRAVEQPRPLPLGIPVRVGHHWLTLRPAEPPAVEGWATSSSHDRPGFTSELATAPTAAASTRREPLKSVDAERDRLRLWKERQEQRERWLKARQEERRWEARWRAAGADLKARAAVRPPAPPAAESAPPRNDEEEPGPMALEAVAPAADLSRTPLPVVPEMPEIAVCEPPEPERSDRVLTAPDPDPVAVAEEAETPRVIAPRPRRRGVATLGVSLDPSEMEEEWDAPTPVASARPDSSIWAGLLNLLTTTGPGSSAFVAAPAPETGAAAEDAFRVGLLDAHAVEFVAEGLPGAVPAVEIGGEEPATAVEEPGGPEWPSARVIFQQARPPAAPAKAARISATKRPVLTAAREPAHWNVPALGSLWVPCFGLTLLAGAVSVGMAATWAGDDQAAGAIADRVIGRETPITPDEARSILDGTPAGVAWWQTTAGHLLLKAAVADRADAEGRGQVAPLLAAARASAPAHSGVRLALSRTAIGKAGPAESTRDLGLGRDVVALAWTGRRLLEAGKPGPALRAYRGAIAMAAAAGASTPKFLAEAAPARFALPGEDLIAPVVRDMAGRPGWSFEAWSPALEGSPVAALAAARVLKDASSPDAERAIDALLALPGADGLHAASRAEALALRERWEEAAAEYRKALAAAADGPARRSWSYNLAEVYGRLDDIPRRRTAWGDAQGRGPDDEITRRVAAARAQASTGDDPQAVASARP